MPNLFFRRRNPSSASRLKAKTFSKAVNAIELLESRTLCSVSTTSWFAGYLQKGTTWSSKLTTTEGESTTFVQTNVGLTTFNGNSCFQINTTSTNNASFAGKSYEGRNGAGDVVVYGGDISGDSFSQTDVNTPYEISLPATLTQGQTITVTDDDLQTVNNTAGTTSVTYHNTITYTLQSETTSLVNGYQAYEIVVVESDTASDNSTSDPAATTEWISPEFGLVQSTDANGNVTKLISYTGKTLHLAMVDQPTNTTFGDKINPAVTVALQDQTTATDTDSNDAVTVTVALASTSTGQGTLKGTTSVSTNAGVAAFSDLSIDKPGRYALTFTDGTGHTITSTLFDVAAGTLVFKKFPEKTVAGKVVKPGIKVELVNQKGEIVKDAPSLVTLNITGSSTGYPIEGNTAMLVNGIATFDNLKLTKPAEHYMLVATDDQGDIKATSPDFENGGPKLVFQQEPGKVGVNSRIRYAIILKDADGKRSLDNIDSLIFSLSIIDGPATAALTATTDVFSFGFANNSTTPYITVNAPGTYTITATEVAGLGSPNDVSATLPVTSKPFEVVQNHLKFTKQPHTGFANIALKYEVTLKDYRNKTVNSSDGLTFALTPVKDGSGAVLASNNDKLQNGVADNQSTIPIAINVIGSYTITATEVPATPGDPVADPVTSKVFKIK